MICFVVLLFVVVFGFVVCCFVCFVLFVLFRVFTCRFVLLCWWGRVLVCCGVDGIGFVVRVAMFCYLRSVDAFGCVLLFVVLVLLW